jgi:hypothetical protein
MVVVDLGVSINDFSSRIQDITDIVNNTVLGAQGPIMTYLTAQEACLNTGLFSGDMPPLTKTQILQILQFCEMSTTNNVLTREFPLETRDAHQVLGFALNTEGEIEGVHLAPVVIRRPIIPIPVNSFEDNIQPCVHRIQSAVNQYTHKYWWQISGISSNAELSQDGVSMPEVAIDLIGEYFFQLE